MNASNSVLNLCPTTPIANLYQHPNISPPPFAKIKSRSMGSLAANKQQEPFYLKLSLPRPIIKHKPRQSDASPRKKMQEVLCSNYASQIEQKKNDFVSEERKRISQQRKYLSDLKRHSNFEASLSQRQRADYSRQLQDQIRSRKVLSEQALSEERRPIKLRQLGILHKAEAFKKFYEHAYSYRDRVAEEYQHYMEGERTYQNTRNKNALLNLEDHSKQPAELTRVEERMKRNDRDSLRHILQRQIQQQRRHRERKQVNYEQVKTEGYHPILNPIDFKVDMKNKYVLHQIVSKHQY